MLVTYLYTLGTCLLHALAHHHASASVLCAALLYVEESLKYAELWCLMCAAASGYTGCFWLLLAGANALATEWLLCRGFGQECKTVALVVCRGIRGLLQTLAAASALATKWCLVEALAKNAKLSRFLSAVASEDSCRLWPLRVRWLQGCSVVVGAVSSPVEDLCCDADMRRAMNPLCVLLLVMLVSGCICCDVVLLHHRLASGMCFQGHVALGLCCTLSARADSACSLQYRCFELLLACVLMQFE
jgi:hypothetical protein